MNLEEWTVLGLYAFLSGGVIVAAISGPWVISVSTTKTTSIIEKDNIESEE